MTAQCGCMTLGTMAPGRGAREQAPARPAAVELPPDHRDAETVARLLAGDEAVFEELVNRYHSAFVRVAMAYVGRREVAEEVAQETWVAVLRGLPRFQGRSSLKNWMFRILTNRAKTRGVREGRHVPFSTWRPERGDDELAPDAESFDANGRRLLESGEWMAFDPERRLLDAETESLILAAIEELPDKQRVVITMRDVEGFSSEDVRALLDLSETYQRVLLHRARVKVRHALADHLNQG